MAFVDPCARRGQASPSAFLSVLYRAGGVNELQIAAMGIMRRRLTFEEASGDFIFPILPLGSALGPWNCVAWQGPRCQRGSGRLAAASVFMHAAERALSFSHLSSGNLR